MMLNIGILPMKLAILALWSDLNVSLMDDRK